jgi:hypothetical protein
MYTKIPKNILFEATISLLLVFWYKNAMAQLSYMMPHYAVSHFLLLIKEVFIKTLALQLVDYCLWSKACNQKLLIAVPSGGITQQLLRVGGSIEGRFSISLQAPFFVFGVVRVPGYRSRFPALSDFLRSSGSGTWSTQPSEYNWGATWKKKWGLWCRDPRVRP